MNRSRLALSAALLVVLASASTTYAQQSRLASMREYARANGLYAELLYEAGRAAVRTLEPQPAPVEGTTMSPPLSVVDEMEFFAIDSANAVMRRAATQYWPFLAAISPQAVDRDAVNVNATNREPYKGVCRIKTVWRNGLSNTGTGFFVGDRVLVTTAFLVYDPGMGGFTGRLTVEPGATVWPHPDYFDQDYVYKFAVPNAWISRRTIGSSIGWLFAYADTRLDVDGFRFVPRTTTDPELKRMTLRIAGYPSGGYQMQTDSETIDQVVYDKFLFAHSLDRGKGYDGAGSTGSPLFHRRENKYYVVGFHASLDGGSIGCRFTPSYVTTTKKYVLKYP